MRSINEESSKNGRPPFLGGVAQAESASVQDDEILTVPEVALRLRVRASWIYTHADTLGAYRLGKYLRFSWRRVRNRLDQNSLQSCLGSQPNDPGQDH